MFHTSERNNRRIEDHYDLIVVGGGLSGVCSAIASARAGLTVALVQDRPVLGGNASSEIRVWALGATSHMGNNNRWAREGGIIDEILVENMYRNPDGNPVIFDTVLLEKVLKEKSITLLLNTAVYGVIKNSKRKISSVIAFNSQNSCEYHLSATYFCDASGDGIIGYLSGASYHVGNKEEVVKDRFFSEKDFDCVLGSTILFYTRDAGHPVRYIAPDFVLKDFDLIPKIGKIMPHHNGCDYWWFEYGGDKDTVHDSEQIKFKLWQIVYSAWNYIKNSGNFPEAENLTLEWVGNIPGKRESRRFCCLYMLEQEDILTQKVFDDSVCYGGWAIDLHPYEGVFSHQPSCSQYHSKGIYGIPLRCYISRDIDNLFFAGRIIGSSHIAFGSTRVMLTCAAGGQAVGEAAAICVEKKCKPSDLLKNKLVHELQQRLNFNGQSIPHVPICQDSNLATLSTISSDSTLLLSELPADGEYYLLANSCGQLLPLRKDIQYSFVFYAKAIQDSELIVELLAAEKTFNYTPDHLIERVVVPVKAGEQQLCVNFSKTLTHTQYAFIIFRPSKCVSIRKSRSRISGIVSVYNKGNGRVNNQGIQIPPPGSKFDSFEFFTPERRPNGENFAFKISPALDCFGTENLINGYLRPYLSANCWVASQDHFSAKLTFRWNNPVKARCIRLYFDTDADHPMETIQWGHPENKMPFCVSDYDIILGDMLLESIHGNHETIRDHHLPDDVLFEKIDIIFHRPESGFPIALFGIDIR